MRKYSNLLGLVISVTAVAELTNIHHRFLQGGAYQLETAIDEKCRSAIRLRRSSGNWAIRRGWDIYNPEEDRLSGLRFEERTALVLYRTAGPGNPWAKVMSHYSLRNQIAHGKLLAQRIDLDAVKQEFFQIQGELTRAHLSARARLQTMLSR